MKFWFIYMFSIVSLSAFANHDSDQVIELPKPAANEAFIAGRVAIVEAQCGKVASNRGRPDVLLPPDYFSYCIKNSPIAMFARLEDGRIASIQVCNREEERPKVYCPERDKFNFDDAIRFSN